MTDPEKRPVADDKDPDQPEQSQNDEQKQPDEVGEPISQGE